MSTERPPIAIAGAGSIGVGFALLFALSGSSVRLWDPVPTLLDRAREDMSARLPMLSQSGLLDENEGAVLARVRFDHELADAVESAALVQECAPERVDVKRDLFRRLGELTCDTTVLASSSSALTPSTYAADLACASRIIGAHPGNPPYLLPVVELIPGELTATDTIERARSIYEAAGMRAVLVRKEVEGFVFNRLQGAVLREAYCLVRDGVATVEDIDTVMRDGLGRRWAFMGPFETVDLNTRGGIASHAEKMGPAYARMGLERGQDDPWTADLVADVAAQRRAQLPASGWGQRVVWRDQMLARIKSTLDVRPNGSEPNS